MTINKNLRRRTTRGDRAGFTLVEMLLTVALIFLLSGAVIFNFASLQRGVRLDEGVTQLEALFRYARAEAADTGRRVEIVFGNGLGQSGTNALAGGVTGGTATNPAVQVLWEPDPVGAPGAFVPLEAATPLVERLDDLVQARQFRPRRDGDSDLAVDNFVFDVFPATDDETNAPTGGNGMTADFEPPVTCYPDGSSDSVEVVLRSRDNDDTRRSVVTLSGVTGALRHRTLAMLTDETRSRALEQTSDEAALNEARDQ